MDRRAGQLRSVHRATDGQCFIGLRLEELMESFSFIGADDSADTQRAGAPLRHSQLDSSAGFWQAPHLQLLLL